MNNINWHAYTWYSRMGAFLFFFGVVPVLSFYIGVRYQETLALLNDTPQVAAVSAARNPQATWKTYTNKLYSFSMQYPASVKPVTTKFTKYFDLSDLWRVGADPAVRGKLLVSFPAGHFENANSYPRYFNAEVRVGASVAKQAIDTCTKLADHEQASASEVLGGETWSVFIIQDSKDKDYLSALSMRTVHDDTCFAIEVVRTGSSIRALNANAKDISEGTLDGYYNLAHQIAETFIFTD